MKKENLPQKICPVCNRPFTWRKKWEKNWEEVITCSERCRRERKRQRRSPSEQEGMSAKKRL